MQSKNRILQILLLLLSFISSYNTFGSGFEKTVLWGAEENGPGAAASSSVKGANSLLFNPAGLAYMSRKDKKTEVSLNFSPIFSKFEGPLTSNSPSKSKSGFSPSFAAIGSYQLNDKIGLGLGVYTTGGTQAKYEGVDYSVVNAGFASLRPDIESKISIIEAGLGAGMKITEGLTLGVGYRASFVKAKLASAAIKSSAVLIASELKDMDDSNFAAFRLGMQYKSSNDKWGLGLVYRSKIDVEAEGTSSGRFLSLAGGGTAGTLGGGGAVKASTVFPEQIILGSHLQASNDLRLHFEYSWTKYSRADRIRITGNALTLSGSNILANGASDVILKWKDQHSVKLGVNYTGLGNIKLRGGYVYISKVTNKGNARAALLPPGAAHTVLAGLGMDIKPDKWQVDFLADYSFASASGNSTAGTSPAVSGKYKANAFAAHLSSKIFF